MDFINVERRSAVATIILSRGKVNAVEDTVIAELSTTFADLAKDKSIKAVILTGHGKFFSFGFDVPTLYDRTPEQMAKFVRSYCRLCRDMFLFPKPIVAQINGHAVAGGCILALACDYRIMVSEGAKMALNEITIGATLFASAIEMLRYAAGSRNAERVALSGAMFDGEEALARGLADELVPSSEINNRADAKAQDLAAEYGPAYVSLKNLLKRPLVDEWMMREDQSIREWLGLWFSPETREKLKKVQIR